MVRIGEAAKTFGASSETVRRWEISGKISCERTPGGQRRYDLAALRPDNFGIDSPTRRTVAYARVSSHDQSADLERQQQVLELYCAKQGWTFDIVADLGSGMNDHCLFRPLIWQSFAQE
jgi:predicted site-specific integrase-resolvase